MARRLREGDEALAEAAALLDRRELVAFHDGEAWVVAADGLDDDAVAALRRSVPAPDDLAVLVGEVDDARHVARLPPPPHRGEGDLRLRAAPTAPEALGEDLLVRVPAAPWARRLATRYGPVAAARVAAAGPDEAALAAPGLALLVEPQGF